MPIAMERREDGRILYIQISDPWTADELDQLFTQIKPYFEQSVHPVFFLVEMTLAHVKPAQFLSRIHHEPVLTHHIFGGAAVVNAGAVARALFDVAAAVLHIKPARFFRSENEAWAYLRNEIDRPAQP